MALDEFDELLTATAVVVGDDANELWQRLLDGLWQSGLRLSEAINLSWDDQDKIMVDLSGRRPMLHIPGELEKGNEDRLYPIAPEFAEMLMKTPKAKRVGPVFPLQDRWGKKGEFKMDWVSKVICKIGREANIKVGSNRRTKKIKYASAHDLRRSFGDRWGAPGDASNAPRIDAACVDRNDTQILRWIQRREDGGYPLEDS